MKADDDPLLDPSRDAARIRAFFVHPDHRRRGIGGLILRACVNAAAEAGFRRLELMATLPGVPFYLRYGFEEIEPVRTRLPDGVEVRFVRMGRDLEEQPRLTSDPSNAMSRLNLELTPDQYAPFHVTYISNVADHDPLALLRGQVGRLEDALAGVSDERALHRYAPGKWSIKEVLGHIDDSERIFAYRLLRIARGDVTPLPGFDQNPYVEAGEFDSRPIEELLEDARATRRATLRLVDSIPPAAWGRRTVTAGAPVSARAMLWVIAGHAEHHLILLRERYGMELRNP